MMEVEELMEKLKMENLVLHDDLFARKTANACGSMDNVCFQRDMKKVVKEKDEFARLSPAEKAQRENSAVVKQLKKVVLIVLMEAGEQIGTLTASLEKAVKEIFELKKKGVWPFEC